jgi:hypothetical protein
VTVLWPLTGRGRELEELRSFLAAGRSVVVAGPAGIGKSRLVDEALVGHTGAAVVRVAATAAAMGIPLGAFGSLLSLQQPSANLLSWAIHGIVEHSRGQHKEIAARLFVSLRTVENHLHAVFAKLGVSRREELADLLR